MYEWKTETRKTFLELAIETAGEQIRHGVAEADIEQEEGIVRVVLRRDPFRATSPTEEESGE